MGALASLPMALAGCVATIKEARLEGAARPSQDALMEMITQRQAGIDGGAECRNVTFTAPMVREVVIRRSFADGAQDRNGAFAMLLGGGIGLLAYGQDKVVCPQHGGGCSDATNAAYLLLGVAAIPIALLAYNAIVVQDSRILERVPPEPRPGPWYACDATDTDKEEP
jgi:hypothetical protein